MVRFLFTLFNLQGAFSPRDGCIVYHSPHALVNTFFSCRLERARLIYHLSICLSIPFCSFFGFSDFFCYLSNGLCKRFYLLGKLLVSMAITGYNMTTIGDVICAYQNIISPRTSAQHKRASLVLRVEKICKTTRL